jgi:hypothetical protein
MFINSIGKRIARHLNASNTSCKNRQGTAKTYAHMLQFLMFRDQAQVRVKAMIVAAHWAFASA